MGALRPIDGFEYETTCEGPDIRCVCRRGGLEASVEYTAAPGSPLDRSLIEGIELAARNVWMAGRRVELVRRLHPQPPPRGRGGRPAW